MKKQSLDRFVDDDYASQQQKAGFNESREALNLAVTILMIGVGGLVGDAYGQQCNDSGDQIEERVGGLRQNSEAAGGDADNNLERGDGHRRQHRTGGYGALLRPHSLRTPSRT